MLEFHLGIRHDKVEGIAFPYTGGLKDFSGQSMTLMVPVARLIEREHWRFLVEDRKDIEKAVHELGRVLQQRAFALLDRFSRLEALNSWYNETPGKPLTWVHNQHHRCLRGATIARLSHSKQFEACCAAYAALLSELKAPDHIRERFHRIVNFLKTYSEN